ncbi:MAG: hypothetical protein JXB36_15220, partial [Gammaproteobacteria bacterium]|nr:hypothetical protein [Gammaproteobacteria bacterium]
MNRILTTHVGSLIRPPEVLAMLEAVERGDVVDDAARAATMSGAVADIVRQQAEAGIDVVSDGEVGKISWISYLYERLGGLEVREQPAGSMVLPPSRDRQAFPDFYAEDDAQFASSVRRIMFLGE